MKFFKLVRRYILPTLLVVCIGVWSSTLAQSWSRLDVELQVCQQRVIRLDAVMGERYADKHYCPDKNLETFIAYLWGDIQTPSKLSAAENDAQTLLGNGQTLRDTLTTTGAQLAFFDPSLNVAPTIFAKVAALPLSEQVSILSARSAELTTQLQPKITQIKSDIAILQKVHAQYVWLDEKSSSWKIIDVQIAALNPDAPLTVGIVETVQSISQNWRQQLKTELNSLGIIAEKDFDLALEYRYFTDAEFTTMLTTLDFTKTDSLLAKKGVAGASYVIVDDVAADIYIRAFAKKRGFQEQVVADKTTLSVAENGYALTPDGATAFGAMKQAAVDDGVYFEISSAFRDPLEQKILFDAELQVSCQTVVFKNCSAQEIAAGSVDAALDTALNRVSPPGFSRHHTAHAIDLNDSGVLTAFDRTPAYRWLSKNNYLNAKRFGFVPSYPKLETIIKYGPNPEAWEYLYVGPDVIKSSL